MKVRIPPTAERMPPMTYILSTPTWDFFTPAVIRTRLWQTGINSDQIYLTAEDNIILVNGGGFLKTSILTIGSTSIDANVNQTSLLLQVMCLINFTKDYANLEFSNVFTTRKRSIPHTHNILITTRPYLCLNPLTHWTYYSHLRKRDEYNEGLDNRCQFTKDRHSVNIWTVLKYTVAFSHDYRKVITGLDVRVSETKL